MDTIFSTNRKFKRMFVNILCIVAILAIAFPAMGSVFADDLNPFFRAFPDGNAVDGGDWPLDATVHMAIDDPATVDDPDYWDDATVVASDEGWISTYVRFDFDGEYDLKPGDKVTLSSGELLRYLVVPNLWVTTLDAEKNIVGGTFEGAEAGTTVHVFIGGDAELYVTTDSDGAWAADFDDVGFDLFPGIQGAVEVWFDNLNDSTIFNWTNSRFTVFPEWEFFDGLDWPDGATVTITVAGKPECTTSKESWDGFFNGNFGEGCNVEYGDEVTFTDGITTRTHNVRTLYVTDVVTDGNVDANTVSGKAEVEAGTIIYVWAHDGDFEPLRFITTGSDEWTVDLSGVYKIRDDSEGRSEIRDAMGNATASDWHVTHPHFTVFPEWEWFDGWDWPNEAKVIITVAGKPECETAKESWGYFFNGNFGEGCDVVVGDEVTFTYGDIDRTHTVRNLAITKVNQEDNIVKGTADARAEVHVWPHATGQEQLATANPKGKWNVDFTGIYDLMPGDGGRAEIRDEIGNATAVDWNISNPRLMAFPAVDQIFGYHWPEGSKVNLKINDKRIAKATVQGAPWDPNDIMAFFDFGDLHDLAAGDVVMLSGHDMEIYYTVQNLTVTEVNEIENTVTGTADPGVDVMVYPFDYGDQPLQVTADENGDWFANFEEADIDLVPGMCGRSDVFDEFTNSTTVDWCIPNPRIVASEVGNWFWTTDFYPGKLNLFIYESANEYGGVNLLWSDQRNADEGGFVIVDDHGLDLVPGNYVVVSDGVNQKGLILQPISVTMFDTEYDFMAGVAPAGSEVWAAAGPQDWQERIMVNADQVTGEWFADFAEIGFDITEDMQPWSYAHIYDEDGDANEGSVPTLASWIAAFTYELPAGSFTENGEYPYHFELEWSFPEPSAFSGQGGELDISSDAPVYDGYVLLRGERELRGIKYPEGLSCEEVGEINPDQPMRFLIGWIPDYGMTYSEALTYFEKLTGKVVWSDGMSAELTHHEVMLFSFDDLDAWFNYVCTFTADPILLAEQPDWVNSGITVSTGQSYTIEAFGQMNPCSDTYPNGADYCIFYTPPGAEGVVPYENEFGIFPGPGLRFMALLGRIGDGEPFYVGAGGTFTAEQAGTLWFTPNDNLRTDNQGAYSVLVWLEP